MNWLLQIHATHAVAHAIGVLALVCLAGMALGSVKVRGIGLGTAGVLFAGILTGYFSKPVDHATLEFVKEFGLVLFVFTIGLQLGPGFLAALRQQGLGLNALAATVVALGVLAAPTLGWLLGIDPAAVLGLLSGATTNTPSLGAAQQTLAILPGVSRDRQEVPALAYAVSYPVAIAGTGAMLDQFQRVVGRRSDEDLLQAPGSITSQAVVVTSNRALGKTVAELGLDHLHGVVTTRVTRADLEMSAVPSLRLHFGDVLQLVGDQASIEKAAAFLGNSLKELNEMHFIPLFLGIAFGIALGTVPIAMPGLPQPLRLGLAGGVLVVALVLGRLGRIGRVVWHMPANVNLAFREFGIALFLAAVGLTAGAKFFSTVFSSVGALWLFAGFVITVSPLLLVGVFARAVLKMDFTALSGLVAGSMTDPPALAFASNISRSDGPMVSYATVYPLTMLLRILSVQILALVLCG